MYTAPFQYHRASSIQEALALLEQFGDDAKVLAGGHSLLPVMKLRFASPAHLVDIGRIAALGGITDGGATVTIGATTCHTDVAASAVVRTKAPAIAQAAGQIGDVHVRNRGTIGGSIAHADPGADLPAALIASAAQIVVTGRAGERAIDAERFFTDAFTTTLQSGELVSAVRVPAIASGSGAAYEKCPDAASGYAVCGIAAIVSVAGGQVTAARIAITGLGSHAARLPAVEAALIGKPVAAASARAAAHAADGLDLFDDSRGGADYKANLARVYTARAIARALSNAG